MLLRNAESQQILLESLLFYIKNIYFLILALMLFFIPVFLWKHQNEIKKNKIIRKGIMVIHILIFNFFKIFKINPQKIVLLSSHSREIDGNLKELRDSLKKAPYNYVIYTEALSSNNLNIYHSVKKFWRVTKLSYHICTSRFLILDDYFSLLARVNLRKKTYLIQTWHAGGAFKKFGIHSLQNVRNTQKMSNVKKMHGQYDFVIVSSNEVVSIYAEAFNIDESKVLPLGLPRSDVYYDDVRQKNIMKLFYERSPFLSGKRIILYAPTYRDGSRNNFNLNLDLDYLYENLEGDFLIILKMHPFIKKVNIPENLIGKVYDYSKEKIEDLLLISDILISDYSSLIFEYAILGKPIIFYAYDVAYYEHVLRGFYFDYSSFVPGPVAKTTEEVVDIINNKEWDIEKIKRFADRFNEFSDGKSTQRLVEYIENLKNGV